MLEESVAVNRKIDSHISTERIARRYRFSVRELQDKLGIDGDLLMKSQMNR